MIRSPISGLTLKNGSLVEKQTRVRSYESCEYNGARYHSRAEAAYAMELDVRKAAGEIRSVRRQVNIDLPVNGVVVCRMVVDFVLEMADGSEELHEVKGWESREWEIKRNLFRAIWPERKYVVIPAGGGTKKKRAWPTRGLRKTK